MTSESNLKTEARDTMDSAQIVELAHRPGHAPGARAIGLQWLESGKISTQDAERILKLQKDEGLRFGEAAMKLGLASEADIQQVLARQFDYPYLAGGEGGFSASLEAAYQPFSARVESLRALRSQLMLRWFGEGNKASIVVGAHEHDASGEITANLGIVFSQLGERTLIVDANLRRPSLHGYFNMANGLGLSDILADRADAGAIRRIPHFVDLSLLQAGTQAPNPAELLGKGKMGELMASLSGQYDVILVDTPPASQAADFQVVGARAGGSLITVRKHRTRVHEVAHIKHMLGTAGAQVLGAVVDER